MFLKSMLDIEMLLIQRAKIPINHVDYFSLINPGAYLFFIHGVSVPKLPAESQDVKIPVPPLDVRRHGWTEMARQTRKALSTCALSRNFFD
jgi:hypothetical protein